MKIPVIKSLAEKFSIEQLRAAEASIYEEKTPEIEIRGEDEGEQLTHVLAAIEILQEIEQTQCAFTVALRNYTIRVRNSIS
ncbi:MAG: hypothetical protein RBS07_09390 [Lentimicrobium sp.]|jgi:hypothetical protein|nr:hypothetical protein [Lentimicrobium sp.]